MAEYQEGVLEDYIMTRSSGMLITTTWAHNYGEVLNTITRIQDFFEENKRQESLMVSGDDQKDKADSVIIEDSTYLVLTSGNLSCNFSSFINLRLVYITK